MRLDAMLTPTKVVGLGLSAALLIDSQSSHVNGFPLSGQGVSRRPVAAASSRMSGRRREACHSHNIIGQPSLHHRYSFLSSSNVKPQHHLLATVDDDIIDAVVEEKTAGLALNDDEENTTARARKRDVFKKALRDLASLSLIDYKWRSALFKKNEADRMEEEWMAAMMGEDASYARPMDANDQRRGPLGNAEKSAVQWLMSVIEEEGKRARRIADSDGELIRPKDLSDTDEAGPLSELERRAIKFLSDVTDSEVERVRSGKIRPKDMDMPGPLGKAEARAVLALDRIIESEKYRMDLQRRGGGEAVRPIDVPGPLGEFERYVGDIIRAERQRVKDREANEGKLVRPKDSSMRSGLSEVERKAVDDWNLLQKEEKERLWNLRRFLNERRPMETDEKSPLGVTEAFTVGLLRGPKLVGKVVGRVKELLNSEQLDEDDKEIMGKKGLPASSSPVDLESGSSSSEKN